MQISRFTSSKPSKFAFASDEKSIRQPTTSFVRCYPKNLRNKPSSMGVSAPKGSRGRSESPLSPPQRRFPLAAMKIKKHGSAMRRFPKGDRKALWSPPQRRFPLVAIKTKKHGSAMRRFPKGDRKALWSPPQRRFPLQQHKSSNIDKAKQFCSLLTAPLRCQSLH